jgi:S1-C subfamily serine protease
MDQFGVKKAALKRIARTPPLPGTLAAAGVSSGGWGRPRSTPQSAQWLGATLQEIAGLDEMSALGLGDRNGLLVTRIPARCRAYQAGLRENDVIRAANGRRIRGLADFAAVDKARDRSQPVDLLLWRNQADTRLELRTK